MLRIALCDDDKAEVDKTAAMLEEYLQARPGLKGRVETFQSGEALLGRSKEPGGIDICILDILMPGLNGIETGRRLRLSGNGCEIVFLTSSNEFAADSYDVRAFFYLLKPVEQAKLFSVLDGAVRKLERRRGDAVLVGTSEGERRVLLERILYVERIGRFMRYYCTDGPVDSHTIRVPFRDMVAPLLADRRFYLCGASFVLNFRHVVGVNGQVARLDNGETVMLPRTSAAEFKRAWGAYWLDEEAST